MKTLAISGILDKLFVPSKLLVYDCKIYQTIRLQRRAQTITLLEILLVYGNSVSVKTSLLNIPTARLRFLSKNIDSIKCLFTYYKHKGSHVFTI